MKNEFGFNILTEKNSNISTSNDNLIAYTTDAQTIQSILEYSIEFGTEQYFKSRALSKNHLLVKCKHYVQYYKDSKINIANRVENMNPKVVELLGKLTYLELVKVKPTKSKNQEETEEYRFTKLGRMVALLLLCYKSGQINLVNAEEVYPQVREYYISIYSSHSICCLVFLAHYRLNKVLPTVLQNMRGLLINASTDKYEFLGKIRFLNMVYRNLKMWKVFDVSLEFLSKKEHHIYELFLLHLKLYLEEIEESKSRKFHEYEVTRLEKSKDIDTVVLEGYCSNCKDLSIESMKTIDHLREYVQSYVSKRYLSCVLCPRCEKEYLHFERVVDSSSILSYFDNTVLNENEPIEKELLKRIFDFNREENAYTKKSQQYHWIIHFLNNDEDYHNITDTQDWILAKVPDLFSININDNPSEQKKETNTLFKRHLDKLEKWKILESEPDKSKKGRVNTQKFLLSSFGKMTAAIVETILSEDRKDSYDKLFEQWKSHLSAYPSSLNLFCLKYLDKCKEKGLFKEFVEFYFKSFTSGRHYYIQNINDLFTQMILVKLDEKDKNSLLFDNWKSSFDELDKKTRKLFSNYLRLYINRITLNGVKDYHEYELKRFEVKDKTDQVIVEGQCPSCSNLQYISVNVISYLSYLFDQPDNNITVLLANLKCNHGDPYLNYVSMNLINFLDSYFDPDLMP